MTQNTIVRALRLVRMFRTQSSDMPMQQADVLMTVADNPGVAMSDLATQLDLSQASISRNVAALSDLHRKGEAGLGLVEARVDPDDTRRRLLFLTQKGKMFVTLLVRQIDPDFSLDADTDSRLRMNPDLGSTSGLSRIRPAKAKLPEG